MRVRGNAEGSIWYREDRKRWVAAVSLPNGRRRTHTARTQREAQRWLTETRAGLQAGTVPAKRQVLAAFLPSWLDAQSNLKDSSRHRYASIIAQHLAPALGTLELSRITPQTIEAYKAEKLGVLSAQSVRMHLALLSHALKDAMRSGLIARNPCAAVDSPRSSASTGESVSPATIAALLLAVRSDRLEALYVLALTTGMRQGEILALRWEDIDIDGERPAARVRRTVWFRHATHNYTTPKSNRARVVLLSRMAVEALRRRRDALPLERAAAAHRWTDTDLVFTTYLGTPIVPQSLQRHFLALLARHGLPRVKFHNLRHTTATLLLELGEHPRVVQELLGHSSPLISMSTYSHVGPTLQENAVERLQNHLSALAATALLPEAAPPPESDKA